MSSPVGKKIAGPRRFTSFTRDVSPGIEFPHKGPEFLQLPLADTFTGVSHADIKLRDLSRPNRQVRSFYRYLRRKIVRAQTGFSRKIDPGQFSAEQVVEFGGGIFLSLFPVVGKKGNQQGKGQKECR